MSREFRTCHKASVFYHWEYIWRSRGAARLSEPSSDPLRNAWPEPRWCTSPPGMAVSVIVQLFPQLFLYFRDIILLHKRSVSRFHVSVGKVSVDSSLLHIGNHRLRNIIPAASSFRRQERIVLDEISIFRLSSFRISAWNLSRSPAIFSSINADGIWSRTAATRIQRRQISWGSSMSQNSAKNPLPE